MNQKKNNIIKVFEKPIIENNVQKVFIKDLIINKIFVFLLRVICKKKEKNVSLKNIKMI